MVHARKLGDVLCEVVKSFGAGQIHVMRRPGGRQNPIKGCGDASRAKIDFNVGIIIKKSTFYKPRW